MNTRIIKWSFCGIAGLSADDVGELLGRLPNTVVQKAKRAQARLRELEAE